MVADTNTPLLGLLLQGTGNNNNSWGTNLNNSVITPIENAIAGVVTISGLTGGALDLSSAGANKYATVILTGTLASDLTITAPATAKKWTFVNKLTGNFFVLLKTTGNTAVNLPVGMVLDVTCDGTNMYRADRHKVGELFFHAGASIPPGSIECTGSTPLRASAVDLFAAIGTTWGVGNGATTFGIPDGYTAGKFLRSRTAAVAVGTAQTSQNKSHTHDGSGTTANGGVAHTHTYSGTTGAMSANASHSHDVANTAAAGVYGGSGSGTPVVNFPGSSIAVTSTNTDHTHSYSGTSGAASATNHTHTYSFTTDTGTNSGTESRPENISAILCIRY